MRTDRINPSPQSPGRPRKFETETLLNEALELFWRNGFSATTTRELEAWLGLNQSSIYSQFGSKQNLLNLALDRYEEIASDQLLQPLQNGCGGLEDIQQFFTDLAHWVTQDGRRGCLLINMMAEDGATTESITRRTCQYREKVRLGFMHCLKVAHERGQVRFQKPAQQAQLLLGLALGFNISVRGGASKQELDALLDAVNAQLQAWRMTS